MSTSANVIRYAITDRCQYAKTEPVRHAALIEQAARLSADGVDFLQLREKDLPTQDLIGLARKILNVIHATPPSPRVRRTHLLINSRADVALAAGADGVHIPSGKGQLTPTQIRQLFASVGSREPTISISCHTLADIARARDLAASLILFSPVFGKSVAGKIALPATGLEPLAAACRLAGDIPVLALGSITAANTQSCLAAGATGIAAIRLFR